MSRSFGRIAMMLFITVVIVAGFFGPYLLSVLLIALGLLCLVFPRRREDEEDRYSSGASTMGS